MTKRSDTPTWPTHRLNRWKRRNERRAGIRKTDTPPNGRIVREMIALMDARRTPAAGAHPGGSRRAPRGPQTITTQHQESRA